jgi:hypothetical protein
LIKGASAMGRKQPPSSEPPHTVRFSETPN